MTYPTIVVDPPWPQEKGGPLRGREGFLDVRNASSLPMKYQTMTLPEIRELPIYSIADRNAHLYLWTTNRFLAPAFEMVSAWGFTYSTTLVWAKAPIGAGLGGCYGIATEFVLFARRGQLPALSRIGRNWFTWKRPYDKRGKPRHSAKPPEFFRLVESISPGPRLEMFARDRRTGWSGCGNEYPRHPLEEVMPNGLDGSNLASAPQRVHMSLGLAVGASSPVPSPSAEVAS